MQGKEQDDAVKAMDNYEKMQELIASGDRFNFHFDRSRRIVPRDIQPVVDKRVVEIPIENTQRTPSDFLPVPTKKGRGKLPKRPAKKFHMPDGVITGFTNVSKLGEAEELLEEAETIPLLHDILLSAKEMTDLERRYQSFAGEDEEVIIAPPALNKHAATQRLQRRTQYVAHGKRTKTFVTAMDRISKINEDSVLHQETTFDRSYLEPKDVGRTLSEKTTPSVGMTKPQKQATPRRGRPPGAKNKITTPKAAKPKARGKQTCKETGSDLSDMEADPSSEPNTSPRMQVRSQAVTLGSHDTSGSEAEDGYMDTDLEDFVVDDDQPLSQVDSSLPSPSAMMKTQMRPTQRSQLSIIESSQDLPDLSTLIGTSKPVNRNQKSVTTIAEESEEEKENRPRVVASKRRRVVSDDEDD
jgi:ATP-dependent DNA helicase MPH1